MNRTIMLVFSLTLASSGQLMAEEPAAATDAMTPAPAAEPAAAPAERAPAAQGSVARAVITSGVTDREPIDELTAVGGDVPVVYFFTDLRDMKGDHITHRWEHDGQVVSEVGFNVEGPRWRVWSSKTMPAGTTGSWKVHVVNSAGDILTTREFSCGTN